MRFQAPRGTEDVLPAEAHNWQWLEGRFHAHSALYGYKELRTPTFEDAELFIRTSGESSDIVSKEMYEFVDKGGRRVALKPEGTAPVMRAVLEHSLWQQGQTLRLYYVINSFRYNRPQKGRLRELHQFGLELLGSESPEADAEVIEATARFFEKVSIPEVEVLINSIGREACRARYREVVLSHFGEYIGSLEAPAQAAARSNPLRVLDSKDPEAADLKKTLPPIVDYIEPTSKQKFDELRALLQEAGVPHRVDPGIVRGLDYYTDTVFEIQSSRLGAQSSLCGGGRYDGLMEQLGGHPTPAVGVGIGIERLLLVLEDAKALPKAPAPAVFVLRATPAAAAECRRLARELRSAAIPTIADVEGKSLKAQLKTADREGVRVAAIIGDEELAGGYVTLKDLSAGAQTQTPREHVIQQVRTLI